MTGSLSVRGGGQGRGPVRGSGRRPRTVSRWRAGGVRVAGEQGELGAEQLDLEILPALRIVVEEQQRRQRGREVVDLGRRFGPAARCSAASPSTSWSAYAVAEPAGGQHRVVGVLGVRLGAHGGEVADARPPPPASAARPPPDRRRPRARRPGPAAAGRVGQRMAGLAQRRRRVEGGLGVIDGGRRVRRGAQPRPARAGSAPKPAAPGPRRPPRAGTAAVQHGEGVVRAAAVDQQMGSTRRPGRRGRSARAAPRAGRAGARWGLRSASAAGRSRTRSWASPGRGEGPLVRRAWPPPDRAHG